MIDNAGAAQTTLSAVCKNFWCVDVPTDLPWRDYWINKLFFYLWNECQTRKITSILMKYWCTTLKPARCAVSRELKYDVPFAIRLSLRINSLLYSRELGSRAGKFECMSEMVTVNIVLKSLVSSLSSNNWQLKTKEQEDLFPKLGLKVYSVHRCCQHCNQWINNSSFTYSMRCCCL